MPKYVVNVARRPKTRFIRKAAPKPEKFIQILCGGQIRLARRRHQVLPEELLARFWDQLKAKWEGGAIEVHEGGPMGPLFRFDEEPEAELKPEPEEEPEDEPEDGEPEEQVGRPDSSWMKSDIADWIIRNADDGTSKSDLMKFKKDDLLEIAVG